MFTSNPWGDYFMILAPLIAGYYLFIGIRFYGRDLKAKLSGQRNESSRIPGPQRNVDIPDPPVFDPPIKGHQEHEDTIVPETEGDSDQQPAAWQNEELFDQVEQLAAHLKESIEEAHEKEYGKQDFILLLQMTLKDYPALRGAPFQTAINNLIETECAKYGSIHLRDEDKVAIWKQVA